MHRSRSAFIVVATVAASLVSVPSAPAWVNPPRPALSDLDGDGYSDLVVRVPNEDVGDAVDAGAIHVLYGSPNGLTATGDQVWHQDSFGIKGTAEAGDRFGSSITIADFDLDGYADVGVGVPHEDFDGKQDAGVVHLIRGSRRGLTARGDQVWHQDRREIKGVAEAGDLFGAAVDCGYINADAFDELMVGAPGEVTNGKKQGALHLLFGSSRGVRARGDEVWHQDRRGIKGHGENGDGFGSSIAIGDFDADGEEDLAVGAPGENIDGATDAGSVHILRGAFGGVTARGDELWHENVPGVKAAASSNDRFGDSIAGGDFDADGPDDLAIGVAPDGAPGYVHVLYGTRRGLSARDDDLWGKGADGIRGDPAAGDGLGSAVHAADFDGDGRDDLAIGIPREDFDEETHIGDLAGAVLVLYGSGGGVSARDQYWSQDAPGIKDSAEAADQFGHSLSIGNYDGDGQWDLAIAAPGEFTDEGLAGAVNVLYGSRSGLKATRDQFWRQGAGGVKGSAEFDDNFGSGGEFNLIL